MTTPRSAKSPTSRLREPPDSGGLPFFGHYFAIIGDMVGGLDRLYRRLGPVFVGRAFGTTVVNLLGADALDTVLKNRDGHYRSAPGWEPYIGRVFPGAIMAMDGEEHRAARRIMQVAFNRRALTGYLGPMAAAIDRRLATWAAGGPQTLRIYPEYKRLSLDIAALAFMGIELGAAADALGQAFTEMVAATLGLVRWPLPGTAMGAGVRSRQRLVQALARELPGKRRGAGVDLFSRLCQATSDTGERFTDQEVIDHMAFLMMAAHDTSTSTLSTLTYLLARHPEWQERLRGLALAASTAASDDLALTLADARLEPLDWTIKETLRLYPPVASMPRYSVHEHALAGYRIPAGTILGLFPVHVHHLPELWTDPTRFDPERFAAHRREDQSHPAAWCPFGGGVHTCIGQHFAFLEIRAVIVRLLTSFRWSVAADYTMPVVMAPITRPTDNLPISLVPLR